MTIGFIGNPNCGKTTLFNAYTGANLKVANWPGVTVEKKEGAMKYHDINYKLVDLPGTYSLSSYTMEEIISRDYIMSDDVQVLINVTDASKLERNLYLTLQLIELGKPVVVALNMMDIIEKRGLEIDLHRLPELLGVPVIPVSARKKTGLEILIHATAHHGEESRRGGHWPSAKSDMSRTRNARPYSPFDEVPQTNTGLIKYSREIEDKIERISSELRANYPEIKNYRWHAVKLLEKDEEISAKFRVSPELVDKSYETEIINKKYEYIEYIIEEVLVNKEKSRDLTDKADALLTHKIFGLPIFLLIMAFIFFCTFFIGDFLKDYFEVLIDLFADLIAWLLAGLRVHELVYSLVIDGVMAGVGGMLSFLPNIFILFLALALLEDSGYMSRVAYIMDGIMGRFGVSGKAFIPMLLGFGCTVPAVMASRSLENRRDRLRVMLLIPFMSCSAKIPIYVLFTGLFFPNHAVLVSYSMYIIGVLVAAVSAIAVNKISRGKSDNMLLIELPEYKSPSMHTIFIYIWEKIKDYISRAGTVILAASVILWFVLNFGFTGYTSEISESFGAIFGRYLTPVLEPIGLGWWQVGAALIAGLAAKEVVAASFMVLFAADGISELAPVLNNIGFGPLNAYVLMIFCLLYPPCLAALPVIKRESSWGRLAFVAGFQIGAAWLVSFMIYRVGLVLF